MKKIIWITLLFLCLTTNTMAKDINSDELIDLTTFVTKENLQVDGWEVTWKESIDKDDIEDAIATISKDNEITVTEEEDVKKYLAEDMHKKGGLAVSYEVLIPNDDLYDTELIAVIKGSSWDKVAKENYQSKKRMMSHQLFTDSAKTYTCLTTHDDGIISGDGFLEELTNYFNIQQQYTQLDTVKNSTHKKIFYGYIPVWVHNISINGTQTNVQVAVTQSEEEQSKYTIGTPILINEY